MLYRGIVPPESHVLLDSYRHEYRAGRHHTVRAFEELRIGADGLIASSQGIFDLAEYRRRLEQGV